MSYQKTIIEVYDKKNGEVVRFVRLDDLPTKLKLLIIKTEISSLFYQDGEIIAEDFDGNEYNISKEM